MSVSRLGRRLVRCRPSLSFPARRGGRCAARRARAGQAPARRAAPGLRSAPAGARAAHRRAAARAGDAARRAPAAAAQAGDAPAAAAPVAATPAVATPATASATAFNPAISLILAGSYANLSRNPDTYRLQGFVPTGGEVGPGRRGFGIGESELGLSASIDPTFSGQLTVSFGADDQRRRRGGLVPGRRARRRRQPARRPLPVGHRLPQRASRPHLGLRRRAAGLPGVLRRPDPQRRPAAALGRARPIASSSSAPRSAPARSFPGSGGGRNGIGSASLFAHVGDDIGESASWRVGASLLAPPRRRSPLRRRRRAPARRSPTASAAARAPGASTASTSGRPAATRSQRNLILQGEYFQRRESGTLAYDTRDGGGHERDRRLPRDAERLVPAGGLPVHAACGASARATTGSTPARRASAWSPAAP